MSFHFASDANNANTGVQHSEDSLGLAHKSTGAKFHLSILSHTQLLTTGWPSVLKQLLLMPVPASMLTLIS